MNQTKSTLASFLKKYKSYQLVVAFILFWTPVIVFLRIAGEILERKPIGLDLNILHWIHVHSNNTLDHIFLVITSAGNVEYILPISLIIFGYLVYKKRRLYASIILFGMGGAAAANFILKLLFHRDRPAFWHSLITETGYSFPSGHAMLSSALVLSLVAILWNTKWRITSIVLGALVILSIGYSRLYMGVHYPTDIIAGWSVSAVWIITVITVSRLASYEYHKRQTVAVKTIQ